MAEVSEAVVEKAHRLLTEGRLIVDRRVGDEIAATCYGDSGIRKLTRSNGVTRCSCPASIRVICSHMLALSLVTNPPRLTEAQAA